MVCSHTSMLSPVNISLDIFSIKLRQRFYFSSWPVSCGSRVLSWKNGYYTAQGSGRDPVAILRHLDFGPRLIWRSRELQSAHYCAATNTPKTLKAGTGMENNVHCSNSCFFRWPGPIFTDTFFTLQVSLKGNRVVFSYCVLLCRAKRKVLGGGEAQSGLLSQTEQLRFWLLNWHPMYDTIIRKA